MTLNSDTENPKKLIIKEIKFTINRIIHNPMSLIGVSIITFFLVIAAIAPLLAPPNKPDPYICPKSYSDYPLPPSKEHPFGTTGPPTYSDIYYGVIWGTRTSIRVAFIIVLTAYTIGITLGSISGYFGGIVDEIIMRFTDVFFAIPGLLLAMLVITMIGRNERSLITALVLVYWCGSCRLIRGEFLRIKNLPFVEAEKALGTPEISIIFRHILPNALAPIFITASMTFGSIILHLSSLSFLGIGFPVGSAEWGVILSTSRSWLIFGAWWTIIYPGIALTAYVLAWNLLGDAFRDILDPRTRRGLV